MSKKSKLLFGSILLILKNATVIIPLLEGVVSTIRDILKPKKEGVKDEQKTTDAEVVREEDLDRNLGYK